MTADSRLEEADYHNQRLEESYQEACLSTANIGGGREGGREGGEGERRERGGGGGGERERERERERGI